MKEIKKSGKKTLFSGVVVYLFANILNAAIPFSLLPILTRYLDPVEYGKVAMFQTLIGAFSAFIGLSVGSAATRKYYDTTISEKELSEFIGSCMQIMLISSLFALMFSSIFKQQISGWLGLEEKWVLSAIIVSAGTFCTSILLGQWQVRGQAKSFGVLQVSQTMVNLSLSIALVVVWRLGAEGRINAQVLTVTLFSCVAIHLLVRSKLIRLFTWNPKHLKDALAYGLPLIPHISGVFLLGTVDRFVINGQLGLGQAGIYMVAAQLSLAIVLVLEAVNKAYMPWLFERLSINSVRVNREIVLYTYAYFALVLILGVFAFYVGPYFVEFIAGAQYAQAGDVIGWLFLGHAFGGMQVLLVNYVMYSKRTGRLSLVSLSCGLFNVACLFIFINLFGLKGAAIAFCLSMFIRFILIWIIAQYSHPMPWISAINAFKIKQF